MTFITAADLSPLRAGALGRFAQAAVQLEVVVQTAIIRLLPITDEIGRVIFRRTLRPGSRDTCGSVEAQPDNPIPQELLSRLLSNSSGR